MSSNRRYFRGAAPGILRSLVAYGAVTGGSTLQVRNSLYAVIAGSPLIRAFIQTTEPRYRATEQAFLPICEHYARCRLQAQGLLTSENARLCMVALYTMGWVHEEMREENLSRDEYAKLNTTLNTICPDPVVYRRLLARWQDEVRNLGGGALGNNPRRAAYHAAQLHYIARDIVAPEHRGLIDAMCNLNAAEDIPDLADLQGLELSDVDWLAAWRGLNLRLKLRYFELQAVLEFAPTTRRANAAIFISLISLIKMGTMTDEWLENQLGRFKLHNNEVLDTTIVSTTTAAALYRQFAVRAKVSSYQLHDFLLARYVEFTGLSLDSLNWIVEQASLTGAASVSLVADAIATFELRWEVLMALGFPPLEMREWIRAVLTLSQDRLCAIVDSPINSSAFAQVLEACRALMSGATYAGYQGGAGRNLKGAESLGKQLASMVRAQTQARNEERINPANLIRQAYGRDLYEDPQGNVVAVPIGQPIPDPDLIPHRGARNNPVQVLASLPRSDRDQALTLLAEHALMLGKQERWDLRDFHEQRSPLKVVPPEIAGAAATLGVMEVPAMPPYRPPIIPQRQLIYPPWDIGCYLRGPVVRPAPPENRGGPGGGGPGDGGDDEDQFRPEHRDDTISPEDVVQILSGAQAIGEVLPQYGAANLERHQHPVIQRPRPQPPAAPEERDNNEDAAAPGPSSRLAADYPLFARRARSRSSSSGSDDDDEDQAGGERVRIPERPVTPVAPAGPAPTAGTPQSRPTSLPSTTPGLLHIPFCQYHHDYR